MAALARDIISKVELTLTLTLTLTRALTRSCFPIVWVLAKLGLVDGALEVSLYAIES